MDGFVLIDYDADTGKEVWVRTDGDTRTVRTVMPVDDIYDANAAAQVENLNRPFGDLAPVMRVPIHVWQRMFAPAMQQGDERYIRRLLNDSDYSKFRLRAGTV